MNSYRAYRWIYDGRQTHFAEFVVTFNNNVILVIQFDGNLGDCHGFGSFDKIGEYENSSSSYWKLIK